MKENVRKIVEKRRAKHTNEAETTKSVKVSLLNQFVKEFLKEMLEDRKC